MAEALSTAVVPVDAESSLHIAATTRTLPQIGKIHDLTARLERLVDARLGEGILLTRDEVEDLLDGLGILAQQVVAAAGRREDIDAAGITLFNKVVAGSHARVHKEAAYAFYDAANERATEVAPSVDATRFRGDLIAQIRSLRPESVEAARVARRARPAASIDSPFGSVEQREVVSADPVDATAPVPGAENNAFYDYAERVVAAISDRHLQQLLVDTLSCADEGQRNKEIHKLLNHVCDSAVPRIVAPAASRDARTRVRDIIENFLGGIRRGTRPNPYMLSVSGQFVIGALPEGLPVELTAEELADPVRIADAYRKLIATRQPPQAPKLAVDGSTAIAIRDVGGQRGQSFKGNIVFRLGTGGVVELTDIELDSPEPVLDRGAVVTLANQWQLAHPTDVMDLAVARGVIGTTVDAKLLDQAAQVMVDHITTLRTPVLNRGDVIAAAELWAGTNDAAVTFGDAEARAVLATVVDPAVLDEGVQLMIQQVGILRGTVLDTEAVNTAADAWQAAHAADVIDDAAARPVITALTPAIPAALVDQAVLAMIARVTHLRTPVPAPVVTPRTLTDSEQRIAAVHMVTNESDRPVGTYGYAKDEIINSIVMLPVGRRSEINMYLANSAVQVTLYRDDAGELCIVDEHGHRPSTMRGITDLPRTIMADPLKYLSVRRVRTTPEGGEGQEVIEAYIEA